MKHTKVSLCAVLLVLMALSSVFGQNWKTVYTTDFSTNPNWGTNNAENYYWDDVNETYYADQFNINADGEYTSVQVCNDGGSFLLEWDMMIESYEYASGLNFGIWDSDLNTSNEQYISLVFNYSDQGAFPFIQWYSLGAGTQGYAENIAAQWSIDIWYHVRMEYDKDDNTISVDITERDTGVSIGSIMASNVGQFDSAMNILGSSNIRDGNFQAPGSHTQGQFDNINYYLDISDELISNAAYQTDFSSDPGWATNNSSRFYWDDATKAYFTDNYTNSQDWATTDITYNGESFQLTYDVKPIQNLSETGDVNIGLFGSDRISNSSEIEERVYVMFGGYGEAIYLTGYNSMGEYLYSGAGTGLMVNNAWHHVDLKYDSQTKIISLLVTSSCDTILNWQTTMNYGFSSSLSHLGASMVGSWSTSNRHEVGVIDNVRLGLKPYFVLFPEITAIPSDNIQPVLVNTSDELKSIVMSLKYDPSIISVDSIDTHNYTTSNWYEVVETIDNEIGLLTYYIQDTSLLGNPISLEESAIFDIHFQTSFEPLCKLEKMNLYWDTAFSDDAFKRLAFVNVSGNTIFPHPMIDSTKESGYIPGDLNFSQEVDVEDLVYSIDYSFRGGLEPSYLNTLDVNGDCNIDVADIVMMVDYQFRGGDTLECACSSIAKKISPAGITIEANHYENKTIINLSSNRIIKGVQLYLAGENKAELKNLNSNIDMLYSYSEGHFNIGLLDLDGIYSYEPGKQSLIEIDGIFNIEDVVLSDANHNSISPSIGFADKGEILPLEYSLSQNYPNPFNPTTKINFSIASKSDVKLEIYNINGQKVGTIVNRELDAGEHSATWDAGNYSSGVYLYKLTAGDFIKTKKMILLK